MGQLVSSGPTLTPFTLQGSLVGGNANMTIAEDDGRGYPVILNSDGFAVAVPFRCRERPSAGSS